MTRERGTEEVLAALRRAIAPYPRRNPAVLAWRWRYEAGTVTAVPLAVAGLVEMAGPGWAVGIVAMVTSLLAGWPATRRRIIARAWCVITQHRLRTGCAQARIHSRCGRLPAIVWCAPTSYGERVLVWCPAGVTSNDFRAARLVLASACFATDVEVAAHPKYHHLVVLGVIRVPADGHR